jgi:hypothetical protein
LLADIAIAALRKASMAGRPCVTTGNGDFSLRRNHKSIALLDEFDFVLNVSRQTGFSEDLFVSVVHFLVQRSRGPQRNHRSPVCDGTAPFTLPRRERRSPVHGYPNLVEKRAGVLTAAAAACTPACPELMLAGVQSGCDIQLSRARRSNWPSSVLDR